MTSRLPPPPPRPPAPRSVVVRPPSAAAVRPNRRRPVLVFLGIGVAIAGVLVAVGWLAVHLPRWGERIDDLGRAEADAPLRVAVDDPVRWTLYLEPSASSGIDTTYRVVDDRGDEVAVDRSGDRSSYEWFGRSGRSIGTVELDPGTYVVEVTGPDTIALGPSPRPALGRAVVGAALVGLPLVIGGIIVAVVAAVRDTRRRHATGEPPPPSPWSAGEWPSAGAG